MKKQIMTLHQDDLSKAWRQVDSVRRTAKKKYVASQFASFFSNFIFAILTAIAANGLICEAGVGSYSTCLRKIPQLVRLWEQLSGYYRQLCPNLPVLILVTAVIVYAVCFCINGALSLMMLAIYYPRPKRFPEEESQNTTQQLLGMAKASRRYSLRTGSTRGSMIWGLLFMLVQLLLLTFYIMTELGDVGVMIELFTAPAMKLLAPVLKSEMAYYGAQNAFFGPSIMVFFLAIYLAYAAANSLHMLSVQFITRCKVPYTFVAQAEYLHIFNGQEAETVAYNAPYRLAEALEYERLGAYSKAKQLLAEAAHGGNCDAMEHYARHWLVGGAADPAKYWLEKYVTQSDSPSSKAVQDLRRLKWHRRVRAAYLPRSTESI